MKLKSFIAAAGVCALVAGVLVGAAGPATADPSGPTTPIDLDGSGADTTQDVMNGLANMIGFSSWNSIPPYSLITPKPTCPNIARPNTDFDGLAALRRSLSVSSTAFYNAGVNNPPLGSRCFEYARTSVRPTSAQQSNAGLLQYVPFGLDAVGIAKGGTSLVGGVFTLSQLQEMYRFGTPVTATDAVTYDPVDVSNPLDLPAPGSTAVHLLLPRAGSGTASFFAAAMGIDFPVPWVKDWYTPAGGGAAQQVAENDGSAVVADSRALMPYSIAQWLAQQARAGTSIDRRNGARLIGVAPSPPRFGPVISPFTPNGLQLNPNWHSILLREVFNVIPFAATTAGPGTGYLNDLWEIFVDTSNTPISLCRRTSVLQSWGFAQLPAGRCGNVTDVTLRAFNSSQW
ncbi:hypothetical protein GCM10022251_25900 [Phytohabitans flavus]|uniref:PBP domain-containing protein n=1 Tax=Phytohabitans flavus TaxID=1076124 RepID=A0A6F8XPT7_9ACTN|nr:hypothetical protein [Phytohabitans flavus]BCB75817.1 hypothetical protein Pflav_022270 [Phytohabitans flavus]